MYCKKCGSGIDPDSYFCSNCGQAVATNHNDNNQEPMQQKISNSNSYQEPYNPENYFGLNLISFLIPIAAAIMYITYHEKDPKKASSVGKWGLIGAIGTLFLFVLTTL